MKRMPEPFLRAISSNYSMSEIIHNFVDGTPSKEHQYPHEFNGEWLFDFKIPPFQRPIVWNEEQCIRFIESCWLGFDIGSYVINRVEWRREKVPLRDRYLLDGLQRLTAIKKYICNEFKVFGYYWNELDRIEHCRFENITFNRNTVQVDDDATLHEIYNRLNFGGTPHTEDQRAK